MLLLLLLLAATINVSYGQETTCGETYDQCTKELNENVGSFYTWATGGRSPCEDALKLCIYMKQKQ